MSDLYSTQPCLVKVMDPVSISSRADEKALENAKTGKATAVVAVMHIFGETTNNLPNASAKTKKTELGPKSKKFGLNRSKMHPKEAQRPPKDASKRPLVKSKTIRVLLETGLSGDLLFLEKGSNKYIPIVSKPVPESWSTSNGTFKTKKVGDVELSFVEYSASERCTCTRI